MNKYIHNKKKYINPIPLDILRFRAKSMPRIKENDRGLT